MTTTPEMLTLEQLTNLDPSRVPKHIAIIPDGNRRWAKQKQENPEKGHFEGANILIDIVKAAQELGVKTVTFYLFSTENWTRSKDEINVLMWLLQEFLSEHTAEMKARGVCFNTIGDLKALPEEVLNSIEETRLATAACTSINMVVALNYGARNELKRAINHLIDDCKVGKIDQTQITEAIIGSYLDTARWGDPDLFIRTSGEKRISNFLLWQLAYTEIYFADVLWPDFKPKHLVEAITDFQKRERRWGGA